MTRTQAWKKAAEAWDKQAETPNKRFEGGGDSTFAGLCATIRIVSSEEGDYTIYSQMEEASQGLTGFIQYGYWPWTKGHEAEERATFAGLMAAMTQKERDQLAEGL